MVNIAIRQQLLIPQIRLSRALEKLRPPEIPMTIGIGVLCSTKPKPHAPRPDALVIVADTMGSTETDSIEELHKLYFDDAARVHITCAGHVEMASELVPMFIHNIKELSRRSHGT